MVATDSVFEIEVDDKLNASLFFLPLQRKVRGKFDFMRVKEANARRLVDNYPEGVPGQRLRLNTSTGEASLIEPLRDDQEWQFTGRNIEREGAELPKSERFEAVDVATWAYWMIRAVESGNARIVAGTKPKITGTPKKNFFSNEQPSESESILAAIKAQTASFERLGDQIGKLVEAFASSKK